MILLYLELMNVKLSWGYFFNKCFFVSFFFWIWFCMVLKIVRFVFLLFFEGFFLNSLEVGLLMVWFVGGGVVFLVCIGMVCGIFWGFNLILVCGVLVNICLFLVYFCDDNIFICVIFFFVFFFGFVMVWRVRDLLFSCVLVWLVIEFVFILVKIICIWCKMISYWCIL